MIYLLCCVCLLAFAYAGVRLPKKCQSMTDEEYAQYFRTSIMGMK